MLRFINIYIIIKFIQTQNMADLYKKKLNLMNNK